MLNQRPPQGRGSRSLRAGPSFLNRATQTDRRRPPIPQDVTSQAQERTKQHEQPNSSIKTSPLPEVIWSYYQEQGEAESTEERNYVEQIHTWSLKPVHLSASELFHGTASGAPVAGEYLFGPGLHLSCPLMGHGLMVDGFVIIYYRIRTAGIKLIVHCFHAVIANVAV